MKDHTPQLEDGYVRFATEWLEEFIKADYPGAVKEFVLVIARETWGWNATWREIPMPRIAELLGVTISRAKQMRDAAVGRNLVEWTPGTGPKASGSYRVQKDYRNWIPQRVSGEWERKHQRPTGEGVLTSKDALTGEDALPATGEDALPTNRLGRTDHLIDKDRHSKDSTPNGLSPKPAVPAINEPVAEEPLTDPDPEDTRTWQDEADPVKRALWRAWSACGLPGPPRSDPGANGKALKQYGGWLQIAQKNPRKVEAWAQVLEGNGIAPPDGIKAGAHFADRLREAMGPKAWTWGWDDTQQRVVPKQSGLFPGEARLSPRHARTQAPSDPSEFVTGRVKIPQRGG